MTMYKEKGTLKEIGAKVGDVVELIKWGPVWDKYNNFARGKRYTVYGSRLDSGRGYFNLCDCGDDKHFTIISRAAPEGPVRAVTRKEIMPGVYGCVDVSATDDMGPVQLRFTGSVATTWFNKADIDNILSVLTEIRDAL